MHRVNLIKLRGITMKNKDFLYYPYVNGINADSPNTIT